MTIVGLGIDAQDVQAVEVLLTTRARDSFLAASFTPSELEFAQARADRLASLFAAKEAAFKALGTGWIDGRLVEVDHADNGAPRLELHGEAEEIARGKRIDEIHLSLSRTPTTAFAVVILVSSR